MNYQYYLTGLVEIQYTPEEQIIAFFSEGKPVGSYHLSESSCIEIDPTGISSYWNKGTASIRSLTLPREAIRAAKEVLEWSPPAQAFRVDHRTMINDYLDTCKAQRASGLFHFIWARSEGYLAMGLGEPLLEETVFSTNEGTETGVGCLEMILNNQESPCRITFLEGRLESPSYQEQTLRIAISQWSKEILDRFTNCMGSAQTKVIESDLNHAMRSQSWFIKVVNQSVQDTHIFQDIEAAAGAYQVLVKTMAVNMFNSLGANQTHTLLNEAMQSLQPIYRQALQKYALTPAETA